jgi:CotH kinase protein
MFIDLYLNCIIKYDAKLMTMRYFLLLFLIICKTLTAQVSNFKGSTLPILVINTGSIKILDEPKITASMGIIDNGISKYNNLTDPPNQFNGPIGIEYRGSTSQVIFPKKSYSIEIRDTSGNDKNASLLGMPEESDWNLIASYNDKSFLRDPFAYSIASKIMNYAPRFRFVDLVINNIYEGTYILTEKIKRDKNRVNISKLDTSKLTGDALTGGYIIKIDKTTGANISGWSSKYATKQNNYPFFQYHYPDEMDMKQVNKTYITNWINEAEKGIYEVTDINDSLNGYRKYIDENSFINFVIVNELCKNVDGYRLSTFMYKDIDSKNKKLQFGPVWDFNISQGNANYCEGDLFTGWSIEFNNICLDDYFLVPLWFTKIWNSKGFRSRFKTRWELLRKNEISNNNVFGLIDSLKNIVELPLEQNFKKWPVLNVSIWPNKYVGGNYANEINYYKQWLSNRLNWMDNEIQNFSTPPIPLGFLEIKINPNPTYLEFKLNMTSAYATRLQLLVFDNLGKIHYDLNTVYAKGTNQLRFGDNLTSGLYHYSIIINDKLFQSGSLIKL